MIEQIKNSFGSGLSAYKNVVVAASTALLQYIEDCEELDEATLLSQKQYVDALMEAKRLIREELGITGGYSGTKVYTLACSRLEIGGKIIGHSAQALQHAKQWVSDYDFKGDATLYEIGVYLLCAEDCC